MTVVCGALCYASTRAWFQLSYALLYSSIITPPPKAAHLGFLCLYFVPLSHHGCTCTCKCTSAPVYFPWFILYPFPVAGLHLLCSSSLQTHSLVIWWCTPSHRLSSFVVFSSGPTATPVCKWVGQVGVAIISWRRLLLLKWVPDGHMYAPLPHVVRSLVEKWICVSILSSASVHCMYI